MNPTRSLRDQLQALGYDPQTSPMAAAMLARANHDAEMMLRTQASITMTMSDLDVEALNRAFAELTEDSPEPKVDIDWGCCEDPQPRILETNNRLFCRNCRLYLDRREEGDASDGE